LHQSGGSFGEMILGGDDEEMIVVSDTGFASL